MDNIKPHDIEIRKKKYRKKQIERGYSRFEIQVKIEVKRLFDKMVHATAEQLIDDYADTLKIAKAKRIVFENLVNHVKPDFLALHDRIESLKAEVAALTPNAQYFKTNEHDRTHLPEAIASLPNDPEHLKALINKFYQQSLQTLEAANQYKRRAEQQEKLYQAASDFNDVLQQRLDEAGLPKE